MEKRVFNKLTKEIFLEYGFTKEKNNYILRLDDVTIVVRFCSWRGIKSFDYYFYINDLYDDSIPFEERCDSVVQEHMKHTPELPGYHAHEILFEEYDEIKYKELLITMLHRYFDPYKNNALQYLKDNAYCMGLTKKARQYLGLI